MRIRFFLCLKKELGAWGWEAKEKGGQTFWKQRNVKTVNESVCIPGLCL